MESKLPNVGTTIFTVMSQLAHECDAINLSQGFPGFNPDPELGVRLREVPFTPERVRAALSGVR